jgi:hypothetical protein
LKILSLICARNGSEMNGKRQEARHILYNKVYFFIPMSALFSTNIQKTDMFINKKRGNPFSETPLS